jgi:glycosyltransferase involved in cell wall biosynthesis
LWLTPTERYDRDAHVDISVVIPSYNTAGTIGQTLDALSRQATSRTYEVIVVDCSEADDVQTLCERSGVARVVRERKRFNPGEGRNIGARAASGQLLVFVDADVHLAADALEAAYRYYESGHFMFGGALELDEKEATSASYLEHYFFNHEAQAGRPACSRANLSSALMVVERELFLSAGGFADIPRMQDTELSERMARRGVSLTFTPTVLAEQIQDSSMRQVLRKVRLNGQNVYFIRYAEASWLRNAAFFALLPAMAFAKVTRITLRHLRYQDARKRSITLRLAPLLYWAGVYWMAGFYAALIFRRGISQSR